MPQWNIRIPENLREDMESHDEINWSEVARKAIRNRLGGPKSREIHKLVADHRHDNDLLWILHMMSHLKPRHVYHTVEHVFEDEKEQTVDMLYDSLEQRNIDLSGTIETGETDVRTAIRTSISTEGEGEIRERVLQRIDDELENDGRDGLVRSGIETLRDFVDFEQDVAWIKPEGLERTWGLKAGEENVSIDSLVRLGLVYESYYSSNAYSYTRYVVPEYSLDILQKIEEESAHFSDSVPSHDLFDLGDNQDPLTRFIEWMGGRATTTRAERIPEDIGELDEETFEDAVRTLVKEGALVIDYTPHRSRAGSRSSRPARYRYELTEAGVTALFNAFIESI